MNEKYKHARHVVWHPNVHRYFGEQLYYLLIQMSEYVPTRKSSGGTQTKTALDKIHDLLEKCGAHGHCIYEVFGDVDILVRVWLDGARYEILGNSLRAEPTVKNVILFISDREEYLWAKIKGNWKEIGTSEIVKKYTDISEHLHIPEDDDRWKNLWDEGFILKPIGDTKIDAQDVNGENKEIKFFSFLHLVQKLVTQPWQVVSIIEKRIRELDINVEGLSLYFGNSQLGNCLLKGTTYDYYDIYKLVVEGFHTTDLESPPHTYLVASPSWHEADDLVPPGPYTNINAKRIISFANIPFSAVANIHINDPKMRQLLEAYDAISPLLAVDEERLLTLFVSGLLDNDVNTIEMGLMFLFRIEKYMNRYFFDRLALSNPGKNIDKLIANTIDNLQKEFELKQKKEDYNPPTNVKKFTLKDFAVFLGILCKESEVAEVIDKDWKRDIEITINLRNDMAHGRLDKLITDWANFMKRVAPAMLLYYNLWRWMNKTISNKQDVDNTK